MKKGYIRSESRSKKKSDKKRKKKVARIKQYKISGGKKSQQYNVTRKKIKNIMESRIPIYKHKRLTFAWMYPRKFAFEYFPNQKLWILGCYFFLIGINLKSKYDV
jgi:hypothetical protein